MAYHQAELTLLREEERILMKIASKLNDQLNRLKVEELALQSLIRTNQADVLQSSKEAGVSAKFDHFSETAINSTPLLDLEIKHSAAHRDDEEEEDEDDEVGSKMKSDQLTTFLEQMEFQHRVLD